MWYFYRVLKRWQFSAGNTNLHMTLKGRQNYLMLKNLERSSLNYLILKKATWRYVAMATRRILDVLFPRSCAALFYISCFSNALLFSLLSVWITTSWFISKFSDLFLIFLVGCTTDMLSFFKYLIRMYKLCWKDTWSL